MTQTHELNYGDRITLTTGRIVTVIGLRFRGTFATITTLGDNGRKLDVYCATTSEWAVIA